MSGSDGFELTQNLHDATVAEEGATELGVKRIGRYRIERVLGRGSFGLVYLAHDEGLNRRVAVKVPHAHMIASPKDAELYLNEARLVASLDHPSIVPVHDVGNTDDCPCFVVSKYIHGSDLAAKRAQYWGKYVEIAELVAIAAEALHYAHTKGVIHRDVKPSNILIDDYHKPYVVDFGLAIKEEDLGKGPKYVGTPAYMSPEQALGEGHRVDGRTDIYSLGVVLYELLSKRRPFSGRSKEDMLKQVAAQEPKPPRQIDDSIPRELERVCLKALARRAAERYTTALDMAEELWQFVADSAARQELSQAASDREGQSSSPTGDVDSQSSPTLSEASRPMLVVPKGLRSFDEHDADFFVELLPGPRDRHGLPPSVRFWKIRVEEQDADKTFSVGLIYGPSGCGKSSLIKAGLLPRLSPSVEPIYIEAAPEETESRLLLRLRKRFEFLPTHLSLKDSLAHLRRNETLADGRKVLIVLDQFEQWLHAHRAEPDAELVQALRQCDGARVQCVLMVRDDFWMAATRFMHELEVQLIEGHNLAAADLFPERHARQVLEAFGRAFGALPPATARPDKTHEEFLNRAIAGLSEGGKVVCVRLALFAEMMKDKSWTAATLDQLGGTKGVGLRFLEEAFHSSSASPEHRYHQIAARAVLSALLPEVGTDIKGKMRSYAQLLEVSGYANRPDDFDALIQLLDREIRLITPTDPAAVDSESSTMSAVELQQKYFQLTHDYLVPSLRDWLTRKKKETRKGRAELALADRSTSWNAKPENRQLPPLFDYIAIVTLTSSTDWTEPQKQMMAVASKVYGMRAALTCALVMVLVFSAGFINHEVQLTRERERVSGLVNQILVAEIDELPEISRQLARSSSLSTPQLERIADDTTRPASERMRALYALADKPGPRADQLVHGVADCDHRFLEKIRDRVSPYGQHVASQLWPQINDSSMEPSSCLRSAVLLAAIDPNSERWQEIAPTVVRSQLSEDSLYLDEWIELLRPVASALAPHWRERFRNDSAFSTTQAAAARALAHYADAELLCELLLEAEPNKWSTLSVGIPRHERAVLARFTSMLQSVDLTTLFPESDLPKLRNMVATLLSLGKIDEVAPLLSTPVDPSVRTMIILELRDFKIDPALLIDARQRCEDPAVRQTLLLCLGRYIGSDLSVPQQQRLTTLLDEQMLESPHASERSAAEWLLRKRGNQRRITELTDQLSFPGPPPAAWQDEHDWWINSAGQTMCIVRAPRNFMLGSVQTEGGTETSQVLTPATLQLSFAVSAHEVTMPQYKRFRPDAEFAMDVVSSDLCPANRITVVDAMSYCRWLSEQEDLDDDQMCYPPLGEIKPENVHLTEELLSRPGYRLPTEAEWECVCRAGSQTVWHTGQDPSHLTRFGWFVINSDRHSHPVGSLLPNASGLFDLMGNAAEWCQPLPTRRGYTLRGGYFLSTQVSLRTSHPYSQSNSGYSFNGFRVARTLEP